MSAFPSVGPSGEFNPSPIPDPSGKGPPLPHPSYAPLPSGMPAASNVPGSYTLVSGSPTAPVNNRLLLSPSNVPGPPSAAPTESAEGSSTASASGYPSPLPSYPPPPPGSSSLVTYSASPPLRPLFPESESPYPSLPPTASPSAELAAGAGLSPAEIAAVSGGGILICVFVVLLIIWRSLKQGSLPTGRQIRAVVAGAAGEAIVEMTNPMGARALSVSPAVTIRPRNSGKKNSNNKGNNTRKGGGKQKTRKQRGGSIQADLFALARQFTEMIMANGGIMNIRELVRQMVPKVVALINSTGPRERLKNL